MWNQHKNDIILTDIKTKNKHFQTEQNELLLKLKNTKTLHEAVRYYKRVKNFKADPIIESLTSDQFRT